MATVTREPHRLEGTLRSTRNELDRTLGELKSVMNAELDWRTWVARHPWPVIGMAALIGFRLGRGRFI